MLPLDPATRAAQLVDRIAELERVKAAAAAEQAHAAVLLDRARREEEAANGVPRRRQGAGVATEIALARQDSPARGSRHLGFAKALVNEMPHTLAALECGALSEWRATILVRETAYLALEDRQKIDVEMCAETSRLRDWVMPGWPRRRSVWHIGWMPRLWCAGPAGRKANAGFLSVPHPTP